MSTRPIKGKKQHEMISDRQQNIILTYKFLKEGKSVQWIENFFLENQNLKPMTVRMYLLESRKLIATESEMDIDFTSLLHDSRYESIWEKDKNAYLNWSFVVEEPYQRAGNMEIIRIYNSLLTSMKQRENMYGLRDKDLAFALHSNISLTREHRSESFEHHLSRDFDINKLTSTEVNELLLLLEESYEGDMFKKTEFLIADDEEPQVIQRRLESPQRSKEIIKESFDKIKDQPKPERKTTERKTSSIKVIDNTKEVKSKSAEQVQQDLKASIIDSIIKKYKK